MSCQINLVGNIADVGAIRRCLFPTDDSRGSDSWLQLCDVSASPTGDIIAIANERRLVILSSKWDSNSATCQFQISYSGSVHESDNIRAVACLPIVGQSKSSHIVPDWTCVLLGFESGFIRFYTENCELLLEEHLHNEIISSIKCRSQHNPRPDIAPDLHPEEIYIQYQSTVCVVPGSQLFPLLRTFRGELARVQAKGEVLEPGHGNLNPKKWGFQDQATINDIAVVGVNLHGTFDHLLTASTCGGFESKFRSSAPVNNLVLAAGSRPFVGYHYALEGGAPPVLSDVAKAVASKLKSALPGWLTGNKVPADKQMTVTMQPSDTMGCRFGLSDLRRTAQSIVLSPDHKLAAVSDALGRVLLLDAFRGITLRIFKGYREAQCSFMQVPDERHSKHRIGNKVALFLIIYSPKKGTVEIFTVQKGAKVTTFSASKFSRLVYNNYGLMGFTTTSKSRFVSTFDTILIDNDGTIKEISIPFHFALSEKNNKRARDLHLFKKLKQLLKHGECDTETFESEVCTKLCPEIQTSEIKLQTLELLIGDKNVSAEMALKCVEILSADSENISDDLKITSENVRALLNFYLFIDSQGLDSENGNNPDAVTTKLNLSSKQLGNLQRLLDLIVLKTDSERTKVMFTELRDLHVSQFISIFNLNQSDHIKLKSNLDETLLFNAGKQIFEKFIITNNISPENFESNIKGSKIPIRDIFILLVNYWINRPINNITTNLEKEMDILLSVIQILVGLIDLTDLVSEDSNTPSKFWGEIRDILADSPKPFPALTAAILCRSVSQSYELASGSEISLDEDFDMLEVLSQELIEWSLLIGKLEDVSLLNIILSNRPTSHCSTLPKLNHDNTDISLRYILERGRGSVSELVARWLTTCGVEPENLVINDRLLLQKKRQDDSSSSSSSSSDDGDVPEQDIMPHKIDEIKSDSVLFDQINLLKTQFPYSLEAGVVLANMCWEYALAWQKDIQNLNNLEASIKCLSLIPNSHVREGLFNLVWNTHLKIIFESASKLINKVGKLPKERLCRQDTSLTDYQITLFLSISTDFLDKYMDAVQESHGEAKPDLQFEQIWEVGTRSLTELAIAQNSINYDLLHLHYQLSLVLQMITAFSIKHSKPVNNLFESYMSPMFFNDFQAKAQINWDYADSRVQTSRTQFLLKVISSSLETVTADEGTVFAGDHVKWMEKCVDLGRLWNLDLDSLRRYELVQIYVNGFDSFGDEIFSRVEDKKKLGPQLLEIGAKRLKQFLATSPLLCQNMAVLSTGVTRYMEQLNGDWCAPSALEAIENVANRSLLCIDENSYEYKVAEMLLDGCQTLLSIYKSN